MLSGTVIRQRYLDFFKSHGHVVIPSAPLVPENDPTTLFTGSGMQPMIPYLLGEPHPQGTRLVDSQKCFRSQDIEEVGDNRHDSFFEMLGNWSLGDYFKSEQISWIFQFLIDTRIGLGLDPHRLFVSVFRGNPDLNIPKDEETAGIWQKQFRDNNTDALIVNFPELQGTQSGRIFYYDEKKNWWSRAGTPSQMPTGEPGGPDSEVFYDFGSRLSLHENSIYSNLPCHPNCDCGRFLELGNSVFMTYQKTQNNFTPLKQKNIDFGGGLERLTAAVYGNPDIFITDLYYPVIHGIEVTTQKKYSDPDHKPAFQVIADHLKAATFLIADGVIPSNKSQGYFLRRLLRRAMVKIQTLKNNTVSSVDDDLYNLVCGYIIDIYQNAYPDLTQKKNLIQETITTEKNQFGKTLKKGLREFSKLNNIDGKAAFDLFQTYGFPLEVTLELAKERGFNINTDEFATEFRKHQDLSRTASSGMFKGGLQDHSEITTKYHTATHLLQAALRKNLGNHVQQKGSNITSERLRFDFSHPYKLSPEQLISVESLINEKISQNLPVIRLELPKKEALAKGALAFFPEKYPELTNVYQISDFSFELCGGPHVSSTGLIGRIKIVKEESAGAGIRRIYLQLLN